NGEEIEEFRQDRALVRAPVRARFLANVTRSRPGAGGAIRGDALGRARRTRRREEDKKTRDARRPGSHRPTPIPRRLRAGALFQDERGELEPMRRASRCSSALRRSGRAATPEIRSAPRDGRLARGGVFYGWCPCLDRERGSQPNEAPNAHATTGQG